eukprot:COSAG02_NODE_3387_length_6833_cov_54.669884_9_plen_76_part_00
MFPKTFLMCALEPFVALASKMPAMARLARSTTFVGVGTVQYIVENAVRLLITALGGAQHYLFPFEKSSRGLLHQV